MLLILDLPLPLTCLPIQVDKHTRTRESRVKRCFLLQKSVEQIVQDWANDRVDIFASSPVNVN